MPFDPTPVVRPAVSKSGVQLAKLRALEEALRGPMPAKWHWDFREVRIAHPCGSAGCALGLAKHLKILPQTASIPFAFRLPHLTVLKVFGRDAPEFYGVHSMSAVTPLMVADALAAIIAREEGL